MEIGAARRPVGTKAASRRVTRVLADPKPAVEEPETVDPSQDRLIPAPCTDGEYRKLDETRGVRLMCPGTF